MKDFPVIKLVILLSVGILLREVFLADWLIVLVLFISTIIIFYAVIKFNILKRAYLILNIFIGVLVILFGNLLSDAYYTPPNEFFQQIRSIKDVKISGRIDNIKLIRNDRLEFYLITELLSSEKLKTNQSARMLCRIFDDEQPLKQIYNSISPGNSVEVTGYYQKGKEKRNPGEFDYDKYLQSQSISGIVSVNSAAEFKITSAEKDFFPNLLFQIRKSINDKIYTLHNSQTASLLRGLLLADRHEINYDLKNQFINAGVVHVLAVSGLHVGFILLIFVFLFGRFSLHVRAILTIAGLLAFMMITGVPPSVFRATVMAIVLIIAFLTNRSTNLFNSISIAALIILLIDPYEIYSAGFQLSFSAVLAIAAIYPFFDKWIQQLGIKNKLIKNILLFSGVSLSAQIGTLPLTMIYFGKVSIIALLTNLIVIPAIGIIIGLAFTTIIVSIVVQPLALIYASANDLITDLLFRLITFSGKLDFSHLKIAQYSIYDAILFFIFAIVFIYFWQRFNSLFAKLLFFVLILSNIFLYSKFDNKELLPDGYLSVVMIDVGQGDAFLLKFPDGRTALIDAGYVTPNFDYGERVILPLLQYLEIDRIDIGFVSHIDLDHYGGFVSLIYNDKINEIYKPLADTNSAKDTKFEKYLSSKNIPVSYYDLQNLSIGDTRLYILNDKEDAQVHRFADNDRSGLIKIVYGNIRFLFTGDMEKPAEKFYSEKYRDFLDVDILKIGHHGSATSSTDYFLNFVQPEISLISAGYNNRFGHPKDEILMRLNKLNGTIFRTDLDKAIIIRSDGENIKIINWN